jgi:hypothetical protein
MIGACSSRRYLLMSGWMILALFVLAGCSQKPHADIEGKVTLDNSPVPSAMVSFTSVDEATNFSIRCRVDGTYKGIDVPLGPMKVCIDRSAVLGPKRDKPKSSKFWSKKNKKNQQETAAGSAASIPKKYSDPDSSGLITTIKPGTNIYDIELSTN